MALTILHHNGAYNVYCSISDGLWFESALTLAAEQDPEQGEKA